MKSVVHPKNVANLERSASAVRRLAMQTPDLELAQRRHETARNLEVLAKLSRAKARPAVLAPKRSEA